MLVGLITGLFLCNALAVTDSGRGKDPIIVYVPGSSKASVTVHKSTSAAAKAAAKEHPPPTSHTLPLTCGPTSCHSHEACVPTSRPWCSLCAQYICLPSKEAVAAAKLLPHHTAAGHAAGAVHPAGHTTAKGATTHKADAAAKAHAHTAKAHAHTAKAHAHTASATAHAVTGCEAHHDCGSCTSATNAQRERCAWCPTKKTCTTHQAFQSVCPKAHLYLEECNPKHAISTKSTNGTCAPNKNHKECPGNSLKMAPVVCKDHHDQITCLSIPCCAWNGKGVKEFTAAGGILRGAQGERGQRGPQGPQLTMDYSKFDAVAQLDHTKLGYTNHPVAAGGPLLPATVKGVHRDVQEAAKACYGLRPTIDKCTFMKGGALTQGVCWHANTPGAVTFCSEKFALDVANWELAFAACFTNSNSKLKAAPFHPGSTCSFYGADSTPIKGRCLPKKFMAVHSHFSSRHSLLEMSKAGKTAAKKPKKEEKEMLYCADDKDRDVQVWRITRAACSGKGLFHSCSFLIPNTVQQSAAGHKAKTTKGMCVDSDTDVGLAHKTVLFCSHNPSLHPDLAHETAAEYTKLLAEAKAKVTAEQKQVKLMTELEARAKSTEAITQKAAAMIDKVRRARGNILPNGTFVIGHNNTKNATKNATKHYSALEKLILTAKNKTLAAEAAAAKSEAAQVKIREAQAKLKEDEKKAAIAAKKLAEEKKKVSAETNKLIKETKLKVQEADHAAEVALKEAEKEAGQLMPKFAPQAVPGHSNAQTRAAALARYRKYIASAKKRAAAFARYRKKLLHAHGKTPAQLQALQAKYLKAKQNAKKAVKQVAKQHHFVSRQWGTRHVQPVHRLLGRFGHLGHFNHFGLNEKASTVFSDSAVKTAEKSTSPFAALDKMVNKKNKNVDSVDVAVKSKSPFAALEKIEKEKKKEDDDDDDDDDDNNN